ncbi:uncharacterized protein LOC136092657 [Hydra vulgaris]|uniref:uncharacterized protein LOC136092657 n=1 Tax=Hydra vulgaris TaxID=6087 RepID=UPI0032E9E80F
MSLIKPKKNDIEPTKLKKLVKKKYLKVLKSTNKIWLVGYPLEDLKTSSLPTTRNVYKFFRYHLQVIDSSYEEFTKVMEALHTQSNISKSRLAALLTIKSVKLFWDKAGIPYKQDKYSIENILRLHEKWRLLSKSKNRISNKKSLLEQNFIQSLDGIFDISSPSWKDDIRKTRSAKDADEDIAWFTALQNGIKTGVVGVKDNVFHSSVRRKKETGCN